LPGYYAEVDEVGNMLIWEKPDADSPDAVKAGEPPKWPWEVKMRGPHTGLPYVREWMGKHGMLGGDQVNGGVVVKGVGG
jgi:hypothetical protein